VKKFEKGAVMSFNKKVVKLLKDKKKTKAQLAKAAGIPYTTLDSMLKRDSDAARLATIYKIAEYLDVGVEELVFDDYAKKITKTELTESELNLIENYRLIDERGKNSVNAIIGYEVSRLKNTPARISSETVRKIPVYLSPAAAGAPLPILADDYSIVKTNEAPDEASFGIKISGDSMEPIIADASVVWVKKQETVASGDVGIFVLNGESLCKKLEFVDGVCKLVSFNDKYKPIEVLESDDLRVIGRVILQ